MTRQQGLLGDLTVKEDQKQFKDAQVEQKAVIAKRAREALAARRQEREKKNQVTIKAAASADARAMLSSLLAHALRCCLSSC